MSNLPEPHPFEPFLPENARILMLGSFPPQPVRWSMDFYYPNFGNDMWRIMGLLFFADREHFVVPGAKKFNKGKIVDFCNETGIAMFDTACEVIRLRDNASDKFLQVTKATDIEGLLRKIPQCRAIVTTGQKATDVLCEHFSCEQPPMGGFSPLTIPTQAPSSDRDTTALRLYRLPSSSRAYPLALEKKAVAYRCMFTALGILPDTKQNEQDF